MLSPSLSGLWLHNPSYNSSVGKGYEEDIYIYLVPKILIGQNSIPFSPFFLSLSISDFISLPKSLLF